MKEQETFKCTGIIKKWIVRAISGHYTIVVVSLFRKDVNKIFLFPDFTKNSHILLALTLDEC